MRVSAAPEPILGIVASAADDREWRLRRTARAAIGFAASGAVGSAIALTALVVEVATKSGHSKFDVLFGLLTMLSPISLLTGLVLGIIARKNRTGKAAIAVSLIPLGLMVLLLFGALMIFALLPR